MGLTLLFSIAGYGAAQIYNGQIFKAFLLFFARLIFTTVGPISALFQPLEYFLTQQAIYFFLSTSVLFIGLVDAFWSAFRNPALLANYKINLAKSLFFFFLSLGTYYSLASFIKNHYIDSYTVSSKGMLPTILPGDTILVDKRYQRDSFKNLIKRGDVVAFNTPDHNSVFAQRIVALAGDNIEVINNAIRVNGTLLTQVSALENTSNRMDNETIFKENNGERSYFIQYASNHSNNSALDIPKGHFYVLGDNRTDSIDSRFFGTLPLSGLIGKAIIIQSSIEPNTKSSRRDRIGKLIQ